MEWTTFTSASRLKSFTLTQPTQCTHKTNQHPDVFYLIFFFSDPVCCCFLFISVFEDECKEAAWSLGWSRDWGTFSKRHTTLRTNVSSADSRFKNVNISLKPRGVLSACVYILVRLHSAIASIITQQHPLANHGLSGAFYSVFTGEKHLNTTQLGHISPVLWRTNECRLVLKVLAENLQEGGKEIRPKPWVCGCDYFVWPWKMCLCVCVCVVGGVGGQENRHRSVAVLTFPCRGFRCAGFPSCCAP